MALNESWKEINHVKKSWFENKPCKSYVENNQVIPKIYYIKKKKRNMNESWKKSIFCNCFTLESDVVDLFYNYSHLRFSKGIFPLKHLYSTQQVSGNLVICIRTTHITVCTENKIQKTSSVCTNACNPFCSEQGHRRRCELQLRLLTNCCPRSLNSATAYHIDFVCIVVQILNINIGEVSSFVIC